MTATSDRILAMVAAYGLGPSLRRLADEPLGCDDWQALTSTLDQGRLAALALAASDTGALPVTAEQRSELKDHAVHAAERCRAAAATLDEIVATLDDAGIDSCVIRGAATSVLDYSETDQRLYDAIYLLVPPDEHARAVATLRSSGVLDAPTGHDGRARRQAEVHHRAGNGIEVGLFPGLTPHGFKGSIAVRDLFDSRVRIAPRGVVFRALGTEERLLAACLHARFDRAGNDLLLRRDVVQLVLRDDLSVSKLEELASTWQTEAILADVVRRAWDTFEVPDVVPLSEWSRSYVAPRGGGLRQMVTKRFSLRARAGGGRPFEATAKDVQPGWS